ncbi:MAG: Uncharacterized protein Greene071421_396 [Parcubacteria group bacterium Greene0714_21]|nr:MAG: Uncharacterized protein Greene041639_49 [Parcubacteria group bacterium Greene0416_39]TSC98159.1 MAG: Uncharacterized protein Greene101447_122 [Parcubacteria group bacterium Greene1014_47]TSD04030.1 MAG: Uncharacterized protein Greene071421_396 [Parcubacteria group bacterium Greene0714_21]
MVKTITQQNKELYQCEECGFRYEEREWAEKCEAWCKEHNSCNIEITSHAMQESTDNVKFLNKLFYGLIGFFASLVFFIALYWVLRLDSSISSFIRDFKGMPLYFWPYVVLTVGAIVLFGINVSLVVYRLRKFGFPRRSFSKGGPATGLGSLLGIAASACPVCGSTLLSAIGIAGGLAVFPLGGLELKALSLGLLALPIWLTRKDIKKLESDCAKGVCPAPRDPFLKQNERHWLIGLLVLTVIVTHVAWGMLKTDPVIARLLATSDNRLNSASFSETGNKLFDEVVAKVLPEKGFQSKIRLSDSVMKLVENGVIDRGKFEAIYEERGGLPPELKDVLTKPSENPMLLTRENANYYVNLLWPLGLTNYMSSNKDSPINGKSLFNFASTGGWNLGKEENGGAYFNKFKIVELTPDHEALATKIAQNTYRPCCNNSTFFQDCNHGSALLGLLQLGATQGLTEDELYREALAFNSFWFPDNYIQTALYFKAVKNTDWENVDPKMVMGKDFSSGSGSGNVQAELAKIPNLIPQQQGGGGCGV